MIDLAQIVERIERRLAELNTTAAEVSAQATDSKDTIRNWARAVDADKKNGTNKASATTIKLNQVERVLGIELAKNVTEAAKTADDRLRSALLAYGVDRDDLDSAMRAIKGFAEDVSSDERSQSDHSQARTEPASRRRERVPSR